MNIIQLGGPAASEVYQTPELRNNILRWVDQGTLAGMLRLEKASTASVAAVLYREVHVSRLSRMSRGSARRKIYCDSVRILDISPLPLPHGIHLYHQFKSILKNTQFDPESVIAAMAKHRKKLPNLRTITDWYPAVGDSDSYSFHQIGDEMSVDLKTVVTLVETGLNPDIPKTTKFPSPPIFKGLKVRHTISIHILGGFSASQQPELNRKWTNWLFCNEKLDRRVTEIHLPSQGFISPPSAQVTLSFLNQRLAINAEPITHLAIELDLKNETTLPLLKQIALAISPSLRSLYIYEAAFNPTSENSLAKVISTIDQSLPSLRELAIEFDGRHYHEPTPLSGMRKLRRLALLHSNYVSIRTVSRKICDLGGKDCVYQCTGGGTMTDMKRFNACVKNVRSQLSRNNQVASAVAA